MYSKVKKNRLTTDKHLYTAAGAKHIQSEERVRRESIREGKQSVKQSKEKDAKREATEREGRKKMGEGNRGLPVNTPLHKAPQSEVFLTL